MRRGHQRTGRPCQPWESSPLRPELHPKGRMVMSNSRPHTDHRTPVGFGWMGKVIHAARSDPSSPGVQCPQQLSAGGLSASGFTFCPLLPWRRSALLPTGSV